MWQSIILDGKYGRNQRKSIKLGPQKFNSTRGSELITTPTVPIKNDTRGSAVAVWNLNESLMKRSGNPLISILKKQ
jgi:hypothetical protein